MFLLPTLVGFFTIILGFPSSRGGFLPHSYYPFLFHSHQPTYSVVPHVHAHSHAYYPSSELSHPISPIHQTTPTSRHSRSSPPVQVITIPISVLRQLLRSEDNPELRPLIIKLEDRNISISEATRKNMSNHLATLPPTRTNVEINLEKLIEEESKFNASKTFERREEDGPFGRRLVGTQGPVGGFRHTTYDNPNPNLTSGKISSNRRK